MSCRGDERINRNLSDVPNIDESSSAGARWYEQPTIVNDIVSIGITQILCKEAWTNNSPSFWPDPKVLLDRVVRHQWVARGTCDGDEYDLPHALTSRDIEEHIEGRTGVGDRRGTKQEDGIAALHCVAESVRFEKVERDHFDVVQRTNLVRLSRANAKSDVKRAKATDDR